MNLYVRARQRWINYIHTVEEFRSLQDSYVPETPIVIGDLAVFNKPMMNMLLKFIEENPKVDIYSSSDIKDPIILSRIVSVIKEPLTPSEGYSVEDFKQSDRSYLAIQENLQPFSYQKKLLCHKIDDRNLAIIESL